jgi:hypothetical protein
MGMPTSLQSSRGDTLYGAALRIISGERLIGAGDIGLFGFIPGQFFAPANIIHPVGI